MSFNKINNIVGWFVALIACSVYIVTAEAGGSLWDCGEFISSCFKLQIPHPPGAPGGWGICNLKQELMNSPQSHKLPPASAVTM